MARWMKQESKSFMKKVPSYRNFAAYTKTIGISSSVANTPYYSVHAFRFKDKKGKLLPARWKFVPKEGIKYLNPQELKQKDSNYLLSAFQQHLKTKPIEYQMYLVFANKNDATNDTTALWKGKHKELLVGTLKVEKYRRNGLQ